MRLTRRSGSSISAGALLLGATALVAPSHAVAFTGYGTPRAGCFDYADPTNDSKASVLGVVPLPGGDSDTEITGVSQRTDSGLLKSFISVAKLGTNGPTSPLGSDDTFTWQFTANNRVVTVSAGRGGSSAAAKAVMGTAEVTTTLRPTATFDAAHSLVVLSVSEAGLGSAVGATVGPGFALTSISQSTTWTDGFGTTTAADTAGGAQRYIVSSADPCFNPLPGKVSWGRIATAQYSDSFAVSATFTDASGAATANQVLYFGLPGQPTRYARTDSKGQVRLNLPATVAAGRTTISTLFLGDAHSGRTAASVSATEALERSTMSLSIAADHSIRNITVHLLDDDKHPIGGQILNASYEGRSVNVRTDGSGTAVVKGVLDGQQVVVSFPGIAGHYAATKGSIHT